MFNVQCGAFLTSYNSYDSYNSYQFLKNNMLEAKNLNISKKGETLVAGLSFVVDNGQMMCVSGSSAATTALLCSLMGKPHSLSSAVSPTVPLLLSA